MATFTGNSGEIEVGATAIGELVSFEFSETAERIQDTVLGDTAHTYKTSLKDASGSFVVQFDAGDTAAELCTAGEAVTLTLRPVGDVSGQREAVVPVVITQDSQTTGIDEIVQRSVNWEATGPVVWSTIA